MELTILNPIIVNNPHLIPAFILDRELIKINEEIIEGLHPELSSIQNSENLEKLASFIRDRLIALRLEEFRQCDVIKELARYKTVTFSGKVAHLKLSEDHPNTRKSRTVNVEDFEGEEKDLKDTLEWLNEIETDKMAAIITEAVNCIAGAVKYERLDCSGPKYGPFTAKRPICTKYFHCESEYEDLENEIIADQSKSSKIFAYNGWVMNWDPEKSFVSSEFDIYLKRQLVVWDDCIKLNYGDGPEDCPMLWDRMESYTRWVATNFDGIRIDNCHSTPLHLAEKMLQIARQTNPNVIVLAELFTGSKDQDDRYVSRLGLDCLVRESLQSGDPNSLAGLVGAFGGESLHHGCSNEYKSGLAGAVMMDVTHDNVSCIEKRSLPDCLSTASVIAFSNSPIGSSRGFDELIPFHINVVTETRTYQSSKEAESDSNFFKCKNYFNLLHQKLSKDFSKINSESHDGVVIIRRRGPSADYLLITKTAFSDSVPQKTAVEVFTHLNMDGIDFYGYLENEMSEESDETPNESEHLKGLKRKFHFKTGLEISDIEDDSLKMKIHKNANNTYGDMVRLILPPGGTVVLKGTYKSADVPEMNLNGLEIGLTEMNQILFSTEKEENSNSPGNGCYDIPNYGKLPYSGFGGIYQLLRKVLMSRDGHSLLDNIRHGPWLLDYLINRIQNEDLKARLRAVADHVQDADPTQRVNKTVTFLMSVSNSLFEMALKKFPDWLTTTNYGRKSAISTVALFGKVKGAQWPLSKKSEFNGIGSLCAGLPHFAEGIWRCWGRDTLISLRGSLILTGRLNEAVAGLVAFGSTLRHGLIPNLLGEGKVSRYNCRDATWFWLNSVKDLYQVQPSILEYRVPTGFISDDADFNIDDTDQSKTVLELIFEIIDRHASGIDFIERNAGPKIDMNMDNRGFHVQTKIDPKTGFPSGGNLYNCGTWMDKMGESEQAKNKGVPSTPRDGAPVEIVGIAHSIAVWLSELKSKGIINREGIKMIWNENEIATWSEWGNRIKENFNQLFWVEDGKYFKDTYGGEKPENDSQLRCNFPIALALSPSITTQERAVSSLQTAFNHLQSGLGLRTLSPNDPNYRPNYFSNDSNDPSTAKGANYHQGPSWMWPIGYFLQASYSFDETRPYCDQIIALQEDYINQSDWMGLPELQNENGSNCPGSCPIQTWSHATMIELLYLKR